MSPHARRVVERRVVHDERGAAVEARRPDVPGEAQAADDVRADLPDVVALAPRVGLAVPVVLPLRRQETAERLGEVRRDPRPNSPSIDVGSGAGSVRQRSRRRSRSKPPMRSKVHVLSVVAMPLPGRSAQPGDGDSVGAAARDEGSDVGFEERIDPELRDGLVLYQALGFEAGDLSGETLATMRTTSAGLFAEAMAEVPRTTASCEDRTVPGPNGDVPVRMYRSVDATGALPGLLWIHGGGMIFGRQRVGTTTTCGATLRAAVGCAVSSVEYRLAPEHPHPAPVEDCYAALGGWRPGRRRSASTRPASRWGDSAGGGLAAGVVPAGPRPGGPAVAFQLFDLPDARRPLRHPVEPGARRRSDWTHERQRHRLAGAARRAGPAVTTSPPTRRPRGRPTCRAAAGATSRSATSTSSATRTSTTRRGSCGPECPTELHVYPGAYHAGRPSSCPGRGSRPADESRSGWRR